MNTRDASRSIRNAPMTGRRLLVAAALALVVAACSGDDDASPTTTQAPPPPESTTTTEATTPTTAPETTPPAPVTAPPTLPAEPTTTATSAPPDEEQIKQDVIDATIASWTAFNELLLDPNDDERLAAIALTRTGDALNRAIEVATQLRAERRKSVTNPGLPAMIDPNAGTIIIDSDAGTAQIDYCRLGSNIAVEIGGNEDGTDRVVDDGINSYLERDSFLLVDGVWLKSGGQTLQKYEGAVECAE